MSPPDDLTFLLGRVAAGDKRAMRAIYMSLGPQLHAFIQTRVKDAHEAADVLQETMLAVWQQADRFEGRSTPRTWIFGIARNKANDRLRRAGLPLAEPDESVPDETPDAQAAIIALEQGEALRHCIEMLKPVQRAAVHLAYFRDLSCAEIAQIEGCAVGTVKTRLHHARLLLLHCLSRRK